MILKELWEMTDGAKLFLRENGCVVEVHDGPGFPVVRMENASVIPVRKITAESWPMYGCVLVVERDG